MPSTCRLRFMEASSSAVPVEITHHMGLPLSVLPTKLRTHNNRLSVYYCHPVFYADVTVLYSFQYGIVFVFRGPRSGYFHRKLKIYFCTTLLMLGLKRGNGYRARYGITGVNKGRSSWHVEVNDHWWNVSAWNSVCKDCEGEGEEELGERQQSVPSKYNIIVHYLY